MVKEEIVFIEDEIEQARKFYSHLNLKDKISSRFLKNGDSLKELLNEKDVIRSYLVDINLGKGRDNEGIEVIKTIRQFESDSLVIVYSDCPDKRRASLEAGADLFFEKNAAAYEDDIRQTRNLISRVLHWDNITTIYSQVVDVDREAEIVRVRCKLAKDSDETFEKEFPLKYFKCVDNLVVDQCVNVHILEKPNQIYFNIEQVDEDYFDDGDDSDISLDHLEGSPIFEPISKF